MPASRRNAQRALKSLAGADAKDSDLPRNLTFYKGRWHIENPRNWEEDHLPIAVALRATRVIKTQQTDWQMMTMLDGPCGKTLLLDEVIQITSWDWQYYNECLTHVALCASIDAPKLVLIIGGGDGACLHEAVRYDSVERVDMVDIDGQVVDLCREEFDFARLAFDHPKANVIIGDGCAFIDAEKGSIAPATYEAAIIDCTDCDQEDMPSDSLYSPAFYANLMRVIKPGGVLTIQAECAYYLRVAEVVEELTDAGFVDVKPYHMPTPCYLEGWHFAVAARRPYEDATIEMPSVTRALRKEAAGTDVYTASRHAGLFDLAPCVQAEIDAGVALLGDKPVRESAPEKVSKSHKFNVAKKRYPLFEFVDPSVKAQLAALSVDEAECAHESLVQALLFAVRRSSASKRNRDPVPEDDTFVQCVMYAFDMIQYEDGDDLACNRAFAARNLTKAQRAAAVAMCATWGLPCAAADLGGLTMGKASGSENPRVVPRAFSTAMLDGVSHLRPRTASNFEVLQLGDLKLHAHNLRGVLNLIVLEARELPGVHALALKARDANAAADAATSIVWLHGAAAHGIPASALAGGKTRVALLEPTLVYDAASAQRIVVVEHGDHVAWGGLGSDATPAMPVIDVAAAAKAVAAGAKKGAWPKVAAQAHAALALSAEGRAAANQAAAAAATAASAGDALQLAAWALSIDDRNDAAEEAYVTALTRLGRLEAASAFGTARGIPAPEAEAAADAVDTGVIAKAAFPFAAGPKMPAGRAPHLATLAFEVARAYGAMGDAQQTMAYASLAQALGAEKDECVALWALAAATTPAGQARVSELILSPKLAEQVAARVADSAAPQPLGKYITGYVPQATYIAPTVSQDKPQLTAVADIKRGTVLTVDRAIESAAIQYLSAKAQWTRTPYGNCDEQFSGMAWTLWLRASLPWGTTRRAQLNAFGPNDDVEDWMAPASVAAALGVADEANAAAFLPFLPDPIARVNTPPYTSLCSAFDGLMQYEDALYPNFAGTGPGFSTGSYVNALSLMTADELTGNVAGVNAGQWLVTFATSDIPSGTVLAWGDEDYADIADGALADDSSSSSDGGESADIADGFSDEDRATAARIAHVVRAIVQTEELADASSSDDDDDDASSSDEPDAEVDEASQDERRAMIRSLTAQITNEALRWHVTQTVAVALTSVRMYAELAAVCERIAAAPSLLVAEDVLLYAAPHALADRGCKQRVAISKAVTAVLGSDALKCAKQLHQVAVRDDRLEEFHEDESPYNWGTIM